MKSKKKNITLQEYQKLCRRTARHLGNREKEIFTYGLGIAGEAGDVAGCIKKTFAHDDDQRKGIRENIGDTMWYVAMICNFFGWDLQEILEENIKKLRKRHPFGFTVKNARRDKRKDWNE